jgi:hypothetical protein
MRKEVDMDKYDIGEFTTLMLVAQIEQAKESEG